MIYDTLEKLGSYKGISKNLDNAIAYLASNNLDKLAVGRYPVDGDNVIVLVQAYETKSITVAKYETHRKYIDIQFILEGQEICYCAPRETLEISEAFNEEKDIAFYKDPSKGTVPLPLTPGVFALFFPQDAHKPSCDLDGKHANRKIVLKIAV